MTSINPKTHMRFTFTVEYQQALSFEQIHNVLSLQEDEGPAKASLYLMQETGLPLHQANPLRKAILFWSRGETE